MSSATRPVRRRRIAGESIPAPAVKKAATPTITIPRVKPTARAGSRPARPDLRWLLPAALLTVAVLVLGAALLIRGVQALGGEAAGVTTAQRQATSAAVAAAESIFTYRYDQLDSYVEDRRALMTPRFGKEFAKVGPLLGEVAPQVKVQMKGVTQEAAAMPCGEECSPDQATVLLFFDQVRLVGDATETTTFPRRLTMTMVRGDDGWLVDDIAYLENSPSLPGESTPGDKQAK